MIGSALTGQTVSQSPFLSLTRVLINTKNELKKKSYLLSHKGNVTLQKFLWPCHKMRCGLGLD